MRVYPEPAKAPGAAILALLFCAALPPTGSSAATVSYSESASASAATGSASSTGQYFNPVYDPNYSGDGPGGLAGMIAAGLHFDSQTPSNVASATPPSGLSASAAPAQYGETVPIYVGTVSGYSFLPAIANAHSSATVSISGNTMHGFAQATGNITPVSLTYVDDEGHTQIVYNPLATKSYAKGVATFNDRVTISSTTIPDGTAVDIQVMATVHAQVTDPEMNLDYIYNNHAGSIFTLAGMSGSVGPVNIYVLIAADPIYSVPSQTTVFHSTVGASFNISDSLVVQALGIASNFRLGGVNVYDNEAQASNTSVLNLSALTAGVTFVSDAGIDYSVVPVPEPTTLSFFGIAMLGLLSRHSRRRPCEFGPGVRHAMTRWRRCNPR
jgi:hypothetical protein